MASKRNVTNQEFEAARKENSARLCSMSKKYANMLSPSALVAARDMALWRCLQYYDVDFGQALTSSLHRFVYWECMRSAKEDQYTSMPIMSEVEDEDIRMQSIMIMEEYLAMLSPDERRIIKSRFFDCRTLQEIADIEGYSKQGIKDIVDRSIAMMSNAACTR